MRHIVSSGLSWGILRVDFRDVFLCGFYKRSFQGTRERDIVAHLDIGLLFLF